MILSLIPRTFSRGGDGIDDVSCWSVVVIHLVKGSTLLLLCILIKVISMDQGFNPILVLVAILDIVTMVTKEVTVPPPTPRIRRGLHQFRLLQIPLALDLYHNLRSWGG